MKAGFRAVLADLKEWLRASLRVSPPHRLDSVAGGPVSPSYERLGSVARGRCRAVPAAAGHGYCASRRALLRAKGSTPSSRAAPGATAMTRVMLMMLIPRCRPAVPCESAYSMAAPTAGPAIAA